MSAKLILSKNYCITLYDKLDKLRLLDLRFRQSHVSTKFIFGEGLIHLFTESIYQKITTSIVNLLKYFCCCIFAIVFVYQFTFVIDLCMYGNTYHKCSSSTFSNFARLGNFANFANIV